LLVLTGVPLVWVSLDWTASFRNQPAALQAAWLVRGLVGAGLVPLVWHAALVVAQPLAAAAPRGFSASSRAGLADRFRTALLALAVLFLLAAVFGGEYQLSQRIPLPDPAPALIELLVVAWVTFVVWRPMAV
jgi:hypothetical protein